MTEENKIQTFTDGQIEALSQALGDHLTGSKIDKLLMQCQMTDNSRQSTKWRRIEWTFTQDQEQYHSPNHILAFIQRALEPVQYGNDTETFEKFRRDINRVLVTAGLEVNNAGKIQCVSMASSIDEIQRRTQNLERILRQRGAHQMVLVYCKEELLHENYFHAVFEAAKSLCDRVREISGLLDDGVTLFEKAFSVQDPYIVMISIESDSEKNRQKGLASMLRGITQMVRNVTAHEPKIKWTINEKDAIDILCAISFLHYQLDQCFPYPRSS